MNRKLALRGYIWLLSVTTALVVATCAAYVAFHPPKTTVYLVAVALWGLAWFCSRTRVHFADSSQVHLGSVAFVATVVVLPLPLAICVSAAGKAASEVQLVLERKRRVRAAFVNPGLVTLSTASAGVSYWLFGGSGAVFSPVPARQILGLFALLSLCVIWYTVDAALVSTAITLDSREKYISVLRQVTRDAALPEVSLLGLGCVLGVLAHYSYVMAPIVVIPVLLAIRSFGAVSRLRDETEGAVKHMAESIDIRDTGTGDHSKRLEEDARRLAAALKLTPEHRHDVGLAARTHDLGKIGISNAILLKEGPLTSEERAIMEDHPVIGADILASYSAFAKSVPSVRHHHERWDGKGYPDGLKGEEIPIGSRIIAVVDSYDAMISDRPYRRGMSAPEAVERLKAGMGSQFDPAVCAAWIQILIEDGVYKPEEPAHHLRLVPSEAQRSERTGTA